MLELTYRKTSYSLPLHSGTFIGSMTVDDNWRDLDYAGGGSSLHLSLDSYYKVPESQLEDLRETGLFDGEVEQPLLALMLEIHHTDFDIQRERCAVIGNLPVFCSLSDFEGVKLSAAICKKSYVSFPVMEVNEIKAIAFGSVVGQSIGIQFSGSGGDRYGKLDFAVSVALPFEIKVEITHGNHVFKGKGVNERLSEIRACFATLYNATRYSAKERVIDPADKSVEIIFSPLN